METLLAALGFAVDSRTRRSRCVIHGGANPTAFAWREDGRWHCFACGKGGGPMELVRETRQCGYEEAAQILEQLAGVPVRRGGRAGRRTAARRGLELRSGKIERAAWRIADEIARLRNHYAGCLHRADRLQHRFGEELLRAANQSEREAAWERLAQLAPAATFYFVAWRFLCAAGPGALARFALAQNEERRRWILEGGER